MHEEIFFCILEILFILELIVISYEDSRSMIIPNRCNAVILILSAAMGFYMISEKVCDIASLLIQMLWGGLILSLPMAMSNLGKKQLFGGGDIKLCFCAGGFLSLLYGPLATVVGGIAGFLTAGIYCGIGLLAGIIKPGGVFPLGPFLSLGFSIVIADAHGYIRICDLIEI